MYCCWNVHANLNPNQFIYLFWLAQRLRIYARDLKVMSANPWEPLWGLVNLGSHFAYGGTFQKYTSLFFLGVLAVKYIFFHSTCHKSPHVYSVHAQTCDLIGQELTVLLLWPKTSQRPRCSHRISRKTSTPFPLYTITITQYGPLYSCTLLRIIVHAND